jgi:capsular exopolysaccharide synthesis family protein
MSDLIAYSAPESQVAEAYRTVYSGLQPAAGGALFKTIAVTSALPGAGKSLVAANLAVVAAQAGKKILLVDCNFGHPMQHTIFHLDNRGLSDCIMANGDWTAFCQPTSQSRLDLLAAGTAAANVVSSEKLRQLLNNIQLSYDLVFLDASSVLAGVGALSVAVAADGVLIVVVSGEERPQDARLVKKRLLQANAHIVGCVLNRAQVGQGYDDYYCRQGGNLQ